VMRPISGVPVQRHHHCNSHRITLRHSTRAGPRLIFRLNLSTMCRMRTLRALALPLVALVLSSCIGNPQVEAATAQAIMDLERRMNEQNQDMQYLQQSIDSLRTVLARDDTLIDKLAVLANVPSPRNP